MLSSELLDYVRPLMEKANVHLSPEALCHLEAVGRVKPEPLSFLYPRCLLLKHKGDLSGVLEELTDEYSDAKYEKFQLTKTMWLAWNREFVES